MSKPVILSIAFHILIFVIASVGLPHFAKDIEPLEMAITVEIADLAEVNRAETPPMKPKPIYNNTDNVPDLIPLKEVDAGDVPELSADPPKALPKLSPPPKPRNKPRRKPKPVKPKPEPPKDEVKPVEQKDFTSLLRSLTPDEPEEQTTTAPAPETQENVSQVAGFAKQMTRNELSDLNRGVQPCWNVNAGGKDAHSLIVELWVFVNQDRTVREVQIINQRLYNSDSHFKAAAEAARRALLNQQCSTLNLPPEKYDRWKKFKYIFDPSNML